MGGSQTAVGLVHILAQLPAAIVRAGSFQANVDGQHFAQMHFTKILGAFLKQHRPQAQAGEFATGKARLRQPAQPGVGA